MEETTFEIVLAGDGERNIRALRALLKKLGRVHGIKCLAVREVAAESREENIHE